VPKRVDAEGAVGLTKSPSVLPPFLQGLRPTLHIAHRGGALLAPENTRAAFDAALQRWHTDMLELDVHLTRDGELVVSHDPTVQRCTNGEGPIREKTLAELQRLDAGYHYTPDSGLTYPFRGQGVRMPSFREVLTAYKGVRLNVELKEDRPGAAEALAAQVRAAAAEAWVCLGSELDALGERLTLLLPDVAHFYPRDALTQAVLAVKSGEAVPLAPYSVLDMPHRYAGVALVDRDFLAAARGAAKWVNVWTVDAEPEMRALVALGVGGVMTDRPDLLRRVLDN
jgi:glycerophosphoryl diester phosphodiesterase